VPKRILTGTVVSDKPEKTVVVRVERRVKHPLYGKIIRLSKKYHADDQANEYRLGETVRIEECAPISKLKTWKVLDRIGAAKAAVVEIAEVAALTPESGPSTPAKTGEDKSSEKADETTKEKADKPAKKPAKKAKESAPADA
jgi:small subunit ribosomal protein S17